MNSYVKKLTLLSVLLSLAMIFSFVESQIPPLSAVPGVKIGLANIVCVFTIYRVGAKEAIAISLIRVLLCALLFGSFVSMLYSLSGTAVSFLVMLILKKIDIFSKIGVSILGAVFHNIAQVVCACIVMGTASISLYLPVLIVSGVVSGLIIGLIAGVVINRFNNEK